jgi:WD40 repeat protein
VRFVDSVRIAFATAKGDVTIFWLNGQIERTWEAHVSGLAALEVLSAECLLTAGGYFQSGDDAVKVWQKDYMQFDPSSCATALAGTTKGRRLTIAGCKDGTTRFYDENGSLVDEVMGNPHRLVSGLALDPSESRVAIANATRTLMIAPVPNWSINLK